MKLFLKLFGSVATLSFIITLLGPAPVLAATNVDLRTAEDYSILAGTNVTNTGASTVSGDIGISPGDGIPGYVESGSITLGGVINDANGAALTAQGDKDLAFAALASQGCDFPNADAFQELAGAILVPGVYCATSFHLTDGTLTLSGSSSDVWIFKSTSDLIISGATSNVIFTGGGQPCNVWWRVVSTATLAGGSEFVGNILASTSITFAAGSSLDGRALASTAAVTMSSASITGPTCAATGSSSSTSASNTGTMTVVKVVVNDNGGDGVISDFPLFVSDTPVVSGETTTFAGNSTEYTVHETNTAGYTQSFSGDCNASGVFNMYQGDEKTCVITNDDIGVAAVVPPVPPLINLVKVPSPLSLPDGPGSVLYTYTLTNIGTVPVTDITIVGDSCSPILLESGDTDSDSQLDLTETWIYLCTTNLTETHTNIVVATGWANGLSTSDVATATVVVGLPIVPPLIHVTKIPSPLTLLAGGGNVLYTETITNPGTVSLNNVTLVDDKCSPMQYISGDVNSNSLLDVTETWTYTCTSRLTVTTTNTATATGSANGMTVRDIAIATVVVAGAVPALPATGVSAGTIMLWAFVVVSLLAMSVPLLLLQSKKAVR